MPIRYAKPDESTDHPEGMIYAEDVLAGHRIMMRDGERHWETVNSSRREGDRILITFDSGDVEGVHKDQKIIYNDGCPYEDDYEDDDYEDQGDFDPEFEGVSSPFSQWVAGTFQYTYRVNSNTVRSVTVS